MEMQQHYVVLLRKGPTWRPEDTPESEALQERHLAHVRAMAESGALLYVGPVDAPSPDSDLRGISIFCRDAFDSFDDLKALVEQDPAILAGRLVAEYADWYHSPFPEA